MIPIVSFAGSADSGKTTYLEQLIPVLRQRGYRVGIVKHHGHDFAIDQPGKDTWRFAQAGAETVVLAGPQKLAMIRVLQSELTLAEIASSLDGVDILLAEGYKRGEQAKIEVVLPGRRPVLPAEALLAMVADEVHYASLPTFAFCQLTEMADFLERQLKISPAGREAEIHA